MAEFGVAATELSPAQGAGATPVAPVKEQFVDTSIVPLISDIGNIFAKGLSQNRKEEAEAAKNNIIGSYTKEQQSINDAVARGDIRPDVGATRSRALFGKYAAGYGPYVEDLHKANSALRGGSELGAMEDSVKAAEAVQKGRVSAAQARGVSVYPWMDAETLEKTLQNSELSMRAEREFDKSLRIRAEQRAMSAEERIVNDRERKEGAIKMLTEIAGSNIDKMSSLIQNLGKRVETGMPIDEAQMVLASEFSQIKGALQATASVNPELAGPYRTLFDDLELTAKSMLDPKTRAETSAAQFSDIINRAKLVAITQDPALKAVTVANALMTGNPVAALNATAPITDYIARMTTNDVNSGQYVPQVVGNPTVEKDVLKFLGTSIKKLNEKGYKDNAQAETEAIKGVNNILKQTGDAMKTGAIDAGKMENLAKFFADPDYGKFVASGKLNPEAAQTAKMTWQTTYVPAVQKSINGRLETIQQSFQGGGGVPARDLSSIIDVQFSGSGIVFSAKQAKAMEPYEQKWQKKGIDDLNAVKAGINQSVRIGAHMDGHTDYAKYWEENKYLYLPQIYPARAGVIVNGYKSKGGVGTDPNNWTKVE